MKGHVVEYIRKDGQKQRGVMYYRDQTDERLADGKVFIRLTNLPIKDKDGCWIADTEREPMNIIISKDRLKVVGYID